MNAVIVWLLVAVSNSPYNYGNVTVIHEFSDEQLCERNAKSKEKGFSNTWYLECIKLEKEVD